MEGNERKIRQHELDRWLDDALRARVDAEPRTGLEDRVLARLANEPQGNGFVWWSMVSAATAVIVIAIALTLLHFGVQKQNIAKETPKPSNATPAVLGASPGPTVATAKRHGAQTPCRFIRRREASCCDSPKPVVAIASSRKSRRESLPMLATFPAPRPETAEERLLAQLASRHGSIDLEQDLSVPAFKIQPMEESPSDDTPQD